MTFNDVVELLKSLGIGDNWVYQVFIVVFITLLASFFAQRFLLKVEAQFKKTKNLWDDAVIDALKTPAVYLIWLIGLSWAVKIAQQVSQAAIFSAIDPLRDVLLIGIMTWFLVRLVKNVEANLLSGQYTREPLDQTTVSALGKLARASVIITAVLVVMQSLGYSISGVLAFGGIGGIAIGFAAKDLLANFFGGLMIYLDRPFKVGDWIRSPDKQIEGTVEYIGWRQTIIRTFDKRPLYVPNATFASIAVENPSRMTNRRIYETLGIRYDDGLKMADIVADVKAMLIVHEAIDNNQTMIVNFNSYGPSSLDFFIYTFTKTTDWIQFHEIKQDVLLKLQDIIVGHGAEFAFPTSTLHVPEMLNLAVDSCNIEEKGDINVR